MAVTQLLCSTSNPANGTAATTGNTGFGALSTNTGGSKTFDSTVGINSNTGLAIVNTAGTNQLRTTAFTATLVAELTFTLKTPASNPAAATTFVNARTSSAVSFRLQWNANGALGFLDNASASHTMFAAGVLSASTNYVIQANFTVATSTTGVINVKVLTAAGVQVGSTYSFTGNLGTASFTQFDFDQDAIVGSYGISEIRFDPTTAAGFLAPWVGGVAAPALSGSGSLTAAVVPSTAATVALSGTGSLTGVAVAATSAVASLSGTGALTATAAPTVPVTAAFSGSGVLGAAAVPIVAGPAGLSGSGTLTGSAPTGFTGTAALSGAGTLTGSVRPAVVGAAVLGGTGTLSSAVVPLVSAGAAFSGTGSVTASGKASVATAAAFGGLGALTLTQMVAVLALASLSGGGTLAAAGSPLLPAGPAFTGGGALRAAAAAGFSDVAVLSGSGTLTVAARVTILRDVTLQVDALPERWAVDVLASRWALSVLPPRWALDQEES